VDVLRLPVVGAFLRWRHVRLLLQLVLLAIAVAIVLHGFFGPQIAPRNLSTVLTSIHWRGLLVVAVLALGNLFCTSCPMVLARDAGRRLVAPRFSWPRRLRRKWVGLALFVLVLFSYELFDLWALPRATAWLVLGYFSAALIVDLLFRGATFCKYVCPIGQFNFVASTMAPAELQVRKASTCHDCRTYDCIKGRRTEATPVRITQRGCELGLFLPTKVGNLDCTLCLDCVHACPHDNIGLVARVPGLELLDLRRRSGIGRLAQRPDIAALAIAFTFAALVNAFAMTGPAFAFERWLAGALHVSSEAVLLGVVFALALIVMPAVLLVPAAAATRAMTGAAAMPLGSTLRAYAFALIPFGFGVWLAHYGFHLFTGILTVVPVTQSAIIDVFGSALAGEPAWQWTGMAPAAVYSMQLGFVLLGACGSIALVQATSLRDYPARAFAASVPWHAALVVLAAVVFWILDQPMEMRGLGGTG
jgi:ferredoxin